MGRWVLSLGLVLSLILSLVLRSSYSGVFLLISILIPTLGLRHGL
jgi:hypothetical protein